jgi:hypothetical protein
MRSIESSKACIHRRRAPALLAGSAALVVALAGGSVSPALTTAPPLVQQGSKLTDGETSGTGYFGRAVALSADGDTALVGAPLAGDEGGAATVFARSGSAWGTQATLTDGEAGLDEGHFGHSVALSADGDVAVVGAPTYGGADGAAWVFTRSGSTWARQAKLTATGETGEGRFGTAVALSADGGTVAVGAPGDTHDLGAVWVFTGAGSSWTQQAQLTGAQESGDGSLGRGVALSADGNTLLAGAPGDGHYVGAAWVFARTGTTWSEQGGKLTGGTEEAGEARFGHSVALSADGDTALVGGRNDDGKLGAAWVFARAGATWAQQGAKLTPASGEAGAAEFGYSVALGGDGERALIGGYRNGGGVGAVWLFARSGSSWAQEGEKLTGGEASGRAWFGSGVALSADARTGLVGGVGDDGKAGAAWVFGTPESLEPPLGPPPPGGQASPGTQSGGGGAPGGGASAKQGVEAFRAVGGGVVLLGRTIRVHNGRAAVRLRCTAPVASCRGRLRLVAAIARAARRSPTTTIASVGFSIAHRRSVTVGVTLDAAGRRRLKAGRGSLRASLTVRVSAPRRATHVYRVTLARRVRRR